MSLQTIPSTRFRTEALAPDEQFEAWRERISVIFNVAPLEESPAKGFLAEADAFHLGELVWVRTRFAGQRFLRTPQQLRSDWLDHYLVQYYRDGGYIGNAGGDEVRIRPGSVSVLDLARPVHTHATAAECISLVVPRDVMDALVTGTDTLHGTVLDPGSAGLLADHLASLEHRLPLLAETQAPYISRATCDLLAACLLPSLENRERARERVEALQLAKIRQFIDAELASPGLSADDVCRALRLSRSQLYQLFKPFGGVRKYIQARRLLRIHAALTDPRESRSIMALAERYGFSSHAHVTRAFRQHFGYCPSEARAHPVETLQRYRAGMTFEHAIAAGDDGPGFDDWVRTLRA
ncbi:MAG TPA: helix-turn-helix domain-containing protein [Gammaproteobacteria bacterium]